MLRIWYEGQRIGADFNFVFAIYIFISAQYGYRELISEL
jgi:hypothetical protein